MGTSCTLSSATEMGPSMFYSSTQSVSAPCQPKLAQRTNVLLDPKSLQGHLLLLRSSFSTGPNWPTNTLLLPRTLSSLQAQSQLPQPSSSSSNTSPPQLLLLASPTGQLAALTPLTEGAYRR